MEQNQNRGFHRHVFNAIFLLTHRSSVFQIIPWDWKHLTNHKMQGKTFFDTWYYIVIGATLCVSFSSKSKGINVFPKYNLKSKARDQSIQASKKLLRYAIVKNYLSDHNRKHVRCEIKEQAPQLTLLYHGGVVLESYS